MKTDNVIKAVGLTKIFRTESVQTTALNEVNLEVYPGEFVAIMGPSGCGKSTLLNIMGLLDNPTSGELWFMGQEVSPMERERPHRPAQRQPGFRLPELQPDRRTDGI